MLKLHFIRMHQHYLRAVVKGVPPGVHEECNAQEGGGIFSEGLLDCNKVLKAFAHFAAINVQMARV